MSNDLPTSVLDAVLALIRGDLAENPRRVGKPLRDEVEGRFSARRGAYRIIYTINENAQSVRILDIDHRDNVYRRP
jgi:mRNA interferase RelE/StbE